MHNLFKLQTAKLAKINILRGSVNWCFKKMSLPSMSLIVLPKKDHDVFDLDVYNLWILFPVLSQSSHNLSDLLLLFLTYLR